MVLGNTKWLALPSRAGAEYSARLKALGDEAARLGIGLVPMVTNFGDGAALLYHEPALAEGMPVRDALFVVRGRQAELQPDPPLELRNPGFEVTDDGRPAGWTDEPGVTPCEATVDRAVRREGAASVRFDEPGARDPQGRARLVQEITLIPFRQYRLSVWIKSEGLNAPDAVTAALWTGARHLHYRSLGVKPTQDWTRHEAVFNSQHSGRVLVRLGLDAGGKQGRLWYDNLRMEEIGLLNVVRREGCPVTMRGEDGTVYAEGRDYERIEDPRLGRLHAYGEYSFTHAPPPTRLAAKSRLRDGQRLRVSFYHAPAVYGSQVSICLSEPRAYEMFGQPARGPEPTVLRREGFFAAHHGRRV